MNRKVWMRAAIALLGGAVAGLVLSELIGIAGMLLFGKAIGIKFLPVMLAVVCAGVALLWMSYGKSRQRRRDG